MELKKLSIIIIFILLFSSLNANSVTPNEKLLPYDVVKIQLEALKNNNKNDDGIKVTWLFAHPDNKKITGPYERFRIMIYGQQYRQLLNHDSHKINIIVIDNFFNSIFFLMFPLFDNLFYTLNTLQSSFHNNSDEKFLLYKIYQTSKLELLFFY